MLKVKCSICDEEILRNLQYRHQKKLHPSQSPIFTVLNCTYHRCKLCSKSVPFSENNITTHLRAVHPKLSLNWSLYTSTYLVGGETLPKPVLQGRRRKLEMKPNSSDSETSGKLSMEDEGKGKVEKLKTESNLKRPRPNINYKENDESPLKSRTREDVLSLKKARVSRSRASVNYIEKDESEDEDENVKNDRKTAATPDSSFCHTLNNNNADDNIKTAADNKDKRMKCDYCHLIGYESQILSHIKNQHKKKLNKYPKEIIQLNGGDALIEKKETNKETQTSTVIQVEQSPVKLSKSHAMVRLRNKSGLEIVESLSDVATTRCLVCQMEGNYDQIRYHVYKAHKNGKYEFVRRTYTKCRLCEDPILFSKNVVSIHIRAHHSEKTTPEKYWNSLSDNKTDEETSPQVKTTPKSENRDTEGGSDEEFYVQGGILEQCNTEEREPNGRIDNCQTQSINRTTDMAEICVKEEADNDSNKDNNLEDAAHYQNLEQEENIKMEIKQEEFVEGLSDGKPFPREALVSEEIDSEFCKNGNSLEMIVTRCTVCGKEGDYEKIQQHTYSFHKEIVGKKYIVVKQSHHYCRICNKKILCSKKLVQNHIRFKHGNIIAPAKYWKMIVLEKADPVFENFIAVMKANGKETNASSKPTPGYAPGVEDYAPTPPSTQPLSQVAPYPVSELPYPPEPMQCLSYPQYPYDQYHPTHYPQPDPHYQGTPYYHQPDPHCQTNSYFPPDYTHQYPYAPESYYPSEHPYQPHEPYYHAEHPYPHVPDPGYTYPKSPPIYTELLPKTELSPTPPSPLYSLPRPDADLVPSDSTNGFAESDKEEEVTYRCIVCGKLGSYYNIYSHTNNNHKEIEGKKYEVAKKTYHKCRLCGKQIVFHKFYVLKHVKVCHNVDPHKYWDETQLVTRPKPPSVPRPVKRPPRQPWGSEQDARENGHQGLARHNEQSQLPVVGRQGDIDPEDISTARCIICDKEGYYDNIYKHANDAHKDSPGKNYMALKKTYHECRICGKIILFCKSFVTKHVRLCHSDIVTALVYWDRLFGENRKPDPPFNPGNRAPEQAMLKVPRHLRVFSDDLVDLCKSKCTLCEKVVLTTGFFAHGRAEHKDLDPKDIVFQPAVRNYHKCKICEKELLFKLRVLGDHVRSAHNMDSEDYRKPYLTNSGRPIKSIRTVVRREKGPDDREFSDDPTRVCRILCKICHKDLFKHQWYNHVMRRHSEVDMSGKQLQYEYTSKTYHRCKVCEASMLFDMAAMKCHLLKSHQILYLDYIRDHLKWPSAPVITSPSKSSRRVVGKRLNNTSVGEEEEYEEEEVEEDGTGEDGVEEYHSTNVHNMCLVRCLFCKQVFTMHQIRYHFYSKHRSESNNGTDQSKYEFVRKTFYRCKLCGKSLLFSFDTIFMHVKNNHYMNLNEYKEKYMGFNKDKYVYRKRSFDEAFSVKVPMIKQELLEDDMPGEDCIAEVKEEVESSCKPIKDEPNEDSNQDSVCDEVKVKTEVEDLEESPGDLNCQLRIKDEPLNDAEGTESNDADATGSEEGKPLGVPGSPTAPELGSRAPIDPGSKAPSGEPPGFSDLLEPRTEEPRAEDNQVPEFIYKCPFTKCPAFTYQEGLEDGRALNHCWVVHHVRPVVMKRRNLRWLRVPSNQTAWK